MTFDSGVRALWIALTLDGPSVIQAGVISCVVFAQLIVGIYLGALLAVFWLSVKSKRPDFCSRHQCHSRRSSGQE